MIESADALETLNGGTKMSQEYDNGTPACRDAQTFEYTAAALETIKEQQFQIKKLTEEKLAIKDMLFIRSNELAQLREKLAELKHSISEKNSCYDDLLGRYKEVNAKLNEEIMTNSLLKSQLKMEQMRNNDLMLASNHEIIEAIHNIYGNSRQILDRAHIIETVFSSCQGGVKTSHGDSHAVYGGK